MSKRPPINIPLPIGKVIVFDFIEGQVYVTDQSIFWSPPR